MKAIGIIWGPALKISDAIFSDLNKYGCCIREHYELDISEIIDEFLSDLYPRTLQDRWKNNRKREIVKIVSGYPIKLLFLDVPISENKVFIPRKNMSIYPEVETLKKKIRSHCAELLNEKYSFDNAFHLTDDENEYALAKATIYKYMDHFCKQLQNNIEITESDMMFSSDYFDEYGKRPKKWIFDGLCILKQCKSSNECFGELLFNEIYRLSFGDGGCVKYYPLQKGNFLLCSSFLDGNSEYYSGMKLLKKYIEKNKTIDEQITIQKLVSFNSIDFISRALRDYAEDSEDYLTVLKNLKKIQVIDMMLLQADRNPSNWGIIRNQHGMRLAPSFDNSNILFLNKTEEEIVSKTIEETVILLRNCTSTSPEKYHSRIKEDLSKEMLDMAKTVSKILENFDIFSFEKETRIKYGFSISIGVLNSIKNNVNKTIALLQT